jgi:hypothetical protein
MPATTQGVIGIFLNHPHMGTMTRRAGWWQGHGAPLHQEG